MEKILQAREIALSDLRSCYRDDGILASQVNFTDYWARDTFWASLGLIESGLDLEKVRSSLELFSKYQKANGKVPRKISLDYNGLKYLGLKIARKKPRPIYTSPIKTFFSMDDNLLLVIVFCEYVRKTGDKEFLGKYFSQIEKALAFYQNSILVRDKLLHEIGLGNWMDTVFKKGFVLYTNCLWYRAVKEYEKIVLDFGFSSSALIPKAEEIRAQLQKVFWLEKEKHFSDSVSMHKKQQKYFDLAGNVLAVIFEIANKKQAELILDKIEIIQKKLSAGGVNFFHPTVFPRYPFWKINPVCFPLGIGDYQNGNSWSWIELLLVVAKNKYGRTEGAKIDLANISRVILKNGHLHETYFLDGEPFDHLFWKSAVPFAWSAGLFLYAVKEVEGTVTAE